MSKYSKKIAEKICSLIEEDSYTVVEICKLVGISESTFHEWKKEKTEFSESIKKAKDKFHETILKECERSLLRLVRGYEYEEDATIFVDNGEGGAMVREKKVVKKQVAPNLGAIIHAQTNLNPEKWRNKQSVEHTGKDGKDFSLKIEVLDEKTKSELLKLEEKLK